ncbi:MAG: PqqD family protein [Bryobacteraceae bacterium]|jgi:hypothetical protein
MKRTFTVPEHVIERPLGEKTVLLNLRSGDYYSLNGTGSFFWKGLSKGESLAQLAGQAQQTFEQPPEVVEAALMALAGELERLGLIEPSGEGQ